jgi:capsular exopolysaccharide synthesis family protein
MPTPFDDHVRGPAPSLADYARSIWRRRTFVAIGLVAGLVLGTAVLPRFTSDVSYQARIRLDVKPLASSLLAPQGADKGGNPGKGAARPAPSPLRDVTVAEAVLRQLGPDAARLSAVAGKPRAEWAGALADRIDSTPVPGSTQSVLAYTDADPALAGAVVERYAKQYADNRNANDRKLTERGLTQLQREADELSRMIDVLAARADREDDPAVNRPATTATRTALQNATERWRSQINVIDDVRKQLVFMGQPTVVLGPAVVTRSGRLVSRGVYLALGLLLGLIGGAALALLVEAVRPKVVTPDDVERLTQLVVIGAVPRAPRARIGRRAAIPVVAQPFSPAAEAFRMVVSALDHRGLGRKIRVVAITSADRREGKSTLATNLAHVMARQGRTVVLVSADLRQPGVERLLGLGGPPGLAEFLQGDRDDLVRLLVPITDGLFVLPAGRAAHNPAELLATPKLRRLVRLLQAVRDPEPVILLDTPPARVSADAVTLASVADTALLVTRSGVSRAGSIVEVAQGLRRDGLSMIGAVLLGAGRRGIQSYPIRVQQVSEANPDGLDGDVDGDATADDTPRGDADPSGSTLPTVRRRSLAAQLAEADGNGAGARRSARKPDIGPVGRQGTRGAVSARGGTPELPSPPSAADNRNGGG